MFCEVTNETLTDTMQMNANFVFYIVSYETLRRKELERMQKNKIIR